MPFILSVGTHLPPYYIPQKDAKVFVRNLFKDGYQDIDRLLQVFQNGQIEGRYFSVPLDWFNYDHSFQEKNHLYVQLAVKFGVEAIKKTLHAPTFMKQSVDYETIDAIFLISSSGISTPSIEARIMNQLPFSVHTKRIPIWGLGCGGGAAGLSRAREYCLAFPTANVLVLSIELCSLTFQRRDLSKSNLIGTSLFSDGVACCLVCGDQSKLLSSSRLKRLPYLVDNCSTFMPDSEEVMGWRIENTGLHVVFSKSIPQIIENWLKDPTVRFLQKHQLTVDDIRHFVAHPGGRKVLEAYQTIFGLDDAMLKPSSDVLKKYGNMSSATVLFVLKHFLQAKVNENEIGLLAALGPGFSSEQVLLRWQS